MEFQKTVEKPSYPFYWLDEIVEVTLNPARTDPGQVQAGILKTIRERLPSEIATITVCLKSQAFALYSNEQIKAVAGHYDQAVGVLQKQAAANLDRYPKTGLLRHTGQLILQGLAELEQCLYNRYSAYLPEPSNAEGAEMLSPGLIGKIRFTLSADQLGIVLRAATDAGILVGRSFRKICKAVAPFVSTPWKTDIAPDTLRSHASRPESRDKEIAIDFLEKMIVKIRGYR
jgi:hypothetical protein